MYSSYAVTPSESASVNYYKNRQPVSPLTFCSIAQSFNIFLLIFSAYFLLSATAVPLLLSRDGPGEF